MFERLIVDFRRRCRTAVACNHNFEVAHFGVVPGADDAAVRGDACHDHVGCAKVPEEGVEWCLVERAVHGFEDEVVFLVRRDALGSVNYVAREVIKAEDIIDFTQRESIAERVARRFGSTMAESLLRAATTNPVSLR